jgi:hypothetical protein
MHLRFSCLNLCSRTYTAALFLNAAAPTDDFHALADHLHRAMRGQHGAAISPIAGVVKAIA